MAQVPHCRGRWSRGALAAVFVALALSTSAGAQGTFPLEFVPKGGMEKADSSPMQTLTLSPNRPVGVTKVPGNVTVPFYGVFNFGPKAKQVSVTLLLDEPPGGTPRLFVDGNADGDLTDDPLPSRSPSPYKDTTGTTRTMYRWHTSVFMPSSAGGKPVPVTMGFERYDHTDPASEQPKDSVWYFPDYVSEGQVTLGGKAYPVLLQIEDVSGDAAALNNLSLMIDVNGDGRFQGRSEQYQADKPFNIGGTTYEVGAVSPNGSQFTIVESSKSVAEVPPSPSLRIGRQAPPFVAKTTDGRTINLSKGYKGRLVLLDFWATWCAPCVAEQPGIVQAYGALHGKGLDVVGVCLDNKDEWGILGATRLAAFMKEHAMTWPQVYDGAGIGGPLALLYGISGIPVLLLVDGDTGRILADSKTLRVDNLALTLAHVLALKRQSQAAVTTRKTASGEK